MNKEEVIKLAREAGLVRAGDGWTEPHRWGLDEIARFAALVAAAEREECAKVCEELRPSKPEYDQRFYDGCTFSATAIRNRGKE